MNIFKLILKISSKLTLYPIKIFRVVKVCIKEDFEFISKYKNILSFHEYMTVFILSPVSTNII